MSEQEAATADQEISGLCLVGMGRIINSAEVIIGDLLSMRNNMSKDSSRSHLFIIAFVHLLLLLGMVLCGVVELFFLEGEQQLMKHPFWSKVTIALAVGLFVFWIVLFPIEIFVFERRKRKSQSLPKLTIKDLFGLPFGAANANAKIPKWIKIPVLSILFLLLGILVIFVVMSLLAYLISKAVS